MTCDGSTGEPPEPVQARGIVDRATGIEKARASCQWLFDDAKEVLGRTNDMICGGHLLVMGLASRAAGLHDGAVHALAPTTRWSPTHCCARTWRTLPRCFTPRTTRPSFIGFSDLVVHGRSRWAPSRTTRSKAPTDSKALPSNQFDFCRLY
ncbi:hypothetical protein MUL_5090 [Mycobacterium ulcerans Agy99]|uniref:Uncharacterized protein n=1 Tax=Mycobacterium ulcerans (strain Agy99) TaxID=362242 RepID=A0PSV8_MYCUA|nr:hypothetical protein MUL_5090 [Mycobacterium ulcerans Agy99]